MGERRVKHNARRLKEALNHGFPMSGHYNFRKSVEQIVWRDVLPVLETASDATVRFDERVARDEIMAAGIENRAHFREACATVWLERGRMHVADLVLHDLSMDIGAPSRELVRAAAVLESRRAICRHSRSSLTPAGLGSLRGKPLPDARALHAANDKNEHEPSRVMLPADEGVETGNSVIQHLRRLLDGDQEEGIRLADWLVIVRETEDLPPLLAAAFAWDAWAMTQPLQRQPYLGILLASAMLRARGKAKFHLPTLNLGIWTGGYRHSKCDDVSARVTAFLRAAKAAADEGLKDLSALSLSKQTMEAHLKGKRSNSRLGQLIRLFLSWPIVTVPTAAEALEITPQGVDNLMKMLGSALPCEITGRRHYRAWGIF
jgi:hypothetical protein